MTDVHHQENRGMQKHHQRQQHRSEEPRAHKVVKALTAATAGGSLLVISGLMLTATVIALTLATPVFVLFSPVLVPAVITVSLLTTGFLTSGGLGVAAATVLGWMYKYMTGGSGHQMEHNLGGEFKDKGEKATGKGIYATGGGANDWSI